jgi:hypothetical protein
MAFGTTDKRMARAAPPLPIWYCPRGREMGSLDPLPKSAPSWMPQTPCAEALRGREKSARKPGLCAVTTQGKTGEGSRVAGCSLPLESQPTRQE